MTVPRDYVCVCDREKLQTGMTLTLIYVIRVRRVSTDDKPRHCYTRPIVWYPNSRT